MRIIYGDCFIFLMYDDINIDRLCPLMRFALLYILYVDSQVSHKTFLARLDPTRMRNPKKKRGNAYFCYQESR